MSTRIAASVVIAASLLLGSTGCAFFSPIATGLKYDPSDGVGTTVGDVEVRNAVAVSSDGVDANLAVVVINTGEDTVKVGFQVESDGEKLTSTVLVSGGETISLGNGDVPGLVFPEVNQQPGGLLPVYVQYGSEPGAEILVPVLTGELPEYEHLIL